MKNFDDLRTKRTDEERSFVLRGQTFMLRHGVRPEALAPFDSLNDASTLTDTMRTIDDLVLAMLDPVEGSHTRYMELRMEEDSDPITTDDLRALVEWMVEQQTGRPTGQPSGSTGGLSSTSESSTDGSSSPATEESTT